MRGEKLRAYALIMNEWGSPPHTRGKALVVGGDLDIVGITPARAGKSQSRTSGPWSTWDHPRTRGEKGDFGQFGGWGEGSPPHARGKDSENLEIQAPIFSSAHFSFNF